MTFQAMFSYKVITECPSEQDILRHHKNEINCATLQTAESLCAEKSFHSKLTSYL